MHRVLAYLEQNRNEVVRFAQKLVRINSAYGNEVEVATVIQQKLTQHGIKSRIIGPKGPRKSLVADIGRGKNVLMINGHLDTVPAGDKTKWRVAPLAGSISGGKLYGRGAVDMKSSVAAATFAAIGFVETCTKLQGRLRLLFNFDEESGTHSGIRDALDRGISADAAIIGEPMKPRKISIGAKGFYRFELTVHGKTAHTAYFGHGGVNAVTRMAKLLLALERLKPSWKKHPMFSRPLVTPGTVITGGTAINVYPDECRALVDCRLSYGQSKASLVHEIRQCLEAEKQRDKSIAYRIREVFALPTMLIERTDPIVVSARRAFRQVAGYTPRLGVMDGATDGNLLWATGIPCVIFGVEGKNLHSENEFAYVRSIHLMPRLFAAAAAEYLGLG